MHALDACGKFVLAGVAALASFGTARAGITVLYAFKGGNDGAYPVAGPIEDKAGNLYGTTVQGGSTGCSPNPGCGTVFKLAPDGTETVLHIFTGGSDGAFPGGVIEGSAGDLYGTTNSGGGTGCEGSGCGIVFKVAPDGSETVLYSFAGGNDGKYPNGSLNQDDAGNLYGTTGYGGGTGCGGDGCGTVFELTPDGTETVLYTFATGRDGYHPSGGLIQDKAGNLYGETLQGGTACNGYGCGTVLKLAPDGTETVLYRFVGGSDGEIPEGGLLKGNAGDFYGATYVGGGTGCNPDPGCGTVFRLAANGTETVLYSFAGGSDGANPEAGLIQDKADNLYGTTPYGGGSGCGFVGGCGIVFKLAPDGTETVLYAFGKHQHHGTNPNNLVRGADGQLYDTADAGGKYGYGTVFRLRK